MIYIVIIFQLILIIAFILTFPIESYIKKKSEIQKEEKYQNLINSFDINNYYKIISKLSVELSEDFEKFKEENRVYTLW